MKITGGELKGRRLAVPARGVRPTSERVREAIFSMLGALVEDAEVLDLFAGSGALGLEAWSRGAGRVTFVEQHRGGIQLLRRNLCDLGGPSAPLDCVCADAGDYLARNSMARRFDLVFADPPYREDWLPRILAALANGDALAPGGKLIFEQDRHTAVEVAPPFEVHKDKVYGTTRVLVIS